MEKVIKKIFLAFLIINISGCNFSFNNLSASLIETETQEVKKIEKVKPKAKYLPEGKTFFGFSEKNILFAKKGETKKININFTPIYHPISSAEVKLIFDPKKLQIKKITPAKNTMMIKKQVDNENGFLYISSATAEDKFQKETPLIFFEIEIKEDAQYGETIIKFDPNYMGAYLPNVENTNNAVINELPKLIISVTE